MIFKFYFSLVVKLADVVSKSIPKVCRESKKAIVYISLSMDFHIVMSI